MGTNYYVLDDPTCNNPAHDVRLHIGKSSMGWKFGFHGYPDHDPPLTSWAAWQEFLLGRTIESETARTLTLEELRPVVEERFVPAGMERAICRVDPTPNELKVGFGGRKEISEDEYHDPEGYDFYNGDFS